MSLPKGIIIQRGQGNLGYISKLYCSSSNPGHCAALSEVEMSGVVVIERSQNEMNHAYGLAGKTWRRAVYYIVCVQRDKDNFIEANPLKTNYFFTFIALIVPMKIC
jgi:hypothetical protein